MDLQQEWQQLSAELVATNNSIIPAATNAGASSSVLQQLLFKLKWKLRWIRIIDIPILIAALCTSGDMQKLLIALFVTYEIFRAFAVREFGKIKTDIDYAAKTKKVLEDNVKAIRKVLSIENIFGYIFLPLSAPTGLLAYKLFVYHSFENVYSQPGFILQLFLFSFIGIPFLLLAQKMNNWLFSGHLKQLSDRIKELSE